MQSQYLHPPHAQVVAAEIHPPPASFADTPVHASAHVPATVPTIPLVQLQPPAPRRLIEIRQARPVPTADTVVSLPSVLPHHAHCHPPSASVTQTVPPPAHSHYTRAPLHTYSNVPTGTAAQSYLNVPVLSTATIITSAASHQHVYPQQSIAEQTLRGPTSASAASTVQPAAVSAADVPKQESVAATLAQITNVTSAAPSIAATV